MSYSWNFAPVLRETEALLRGLGVTFSLTFCSIAFGGVIGLLLFLMRLSDSRAARAASIFTTEIFRSLPVLVTLIWLFYCLPILSHGSLLPDPFVVAVLGLGLNFAALEAEIVNAGYEAVPPGEVEAARALGFTPRQALWRIAVPQAYWRSLGPTLGQVVNTLKLTALASFIAVPELFFITSDLLRNTARPLEFYTVMAGYYLLTIYPLSWLVRQLEKEMRRRFRDGA